MDMNTGVAKITIAENISQNCIQKHSKLPLSSQLDNKLVQILTVKMFGSEVAETLKPKMQPFENMTPLGYQSKLSDLVACLQELKQNEKRSVVQLIYQDAIRVLQAEAVSADLLEEFRIMLLQG
ncbi:MAG: hypothetical protein J6Z25_01750 [Opitutales bacterium]|nr:hypothetical protein [Opitutales bacterium]